MTLQYFETLKSIGAGASTKYIFPMEFTSLLDGFLKRPHGEINFQGSVNPVPGWTKTLS
jgi:hypothetical protein